MHKQEILEFLAERLKDGKAFTVNANPKSYYQYHRDNFGGLSIIGVTDDGKDVSYGSTGLHDIKTMELRSMRTRITDLNQLADFKKIEFGKWPDWQDVFTEEDVYYERINGKCLRKIARRPQ